MTDEQTVVTPTDEQSASQTQPVTEESDALDSLLNEYDEGTKVEQPKPDENIDNEVIAFVREQRQEKADRLYNEKLESVFKDMELNVPQKVAEHVLNGMAKDDPRIVNAWKKGDTKAIQKALANELKMESIDQETTTTRDEVTAAVLSASTKQPVSDDVDLSGMSDFEFAEHKAKLLRQH